MGYLYENSNDERFQQLCQSLFLIDFPNLQCFPVGQPDGGRDGLDPGTDTVLQIKFKKSDESENADWLIAALEKEKDKIVRLIAKGAKSYIIATNARGTGHADKGRIDLVQQWLDANIAIPSQAMWRDDLDRRLDNAPSTLKLRYTEILTLEDGLPAILAQLWSPDQERQKNALRSFIAKQYKDDKNIKFKQAEINNNLIDLFIDVPIGLSAQAIERIRKEPDHLSKTILSFLTERQISIVITPTGGELIALDTDFGSGLRQRNAICAAELLLSQFAPDKITKIVIEGAPGQGKSTIAQYVCQVHRARYLQDADTVETISPNHLRSALRIPIKVDLRDLASFLDNKSPFGEGAGSNPSEQRSLELFLASLIKAKSGGIEFTAHDVILLFKQSPVILFLDGLDEVADFDLRKRLIGAIGDCITRLEEFDADAQIVVTSRPSTFGKVPKLDRLEFDTLVLGKLDAERIANYADRWTKASSLEISESDAVKRILEEKLQLPHIRSLTTNAMQLTILLTLIHLVGHSLPDQRTDLYRRYIDLFLTREAEKSISVREHRPILLAFIQHLAWELQRQAESSKSAGSIDVEALHNMAAKYLESSGYSQALADDLFSGGLERIFVLVERIEGLYEFEVQPLREFFCAQHLYSTAPAGTFRDQLPRGDRAQRFEALAANPFWLNVARFYAGFYESGEIGALVLSLQELTGNDDIGMSSHVRRVGQALLQDWVFSTKRFPQDQVIRTIFDQMGLIVLLGAEGSEIDNIALDKDCGQETLRKILFQRLVAESSQGQADMYCGPLRLNGGSEMADDFHSLVEQFSGTPRTKWLTRMFRSGAAKSMSNASITDLITNDDASRPEQAKRRASLFEADFFAGLRCPDLVNLFIKDVLDGVSPTMVVTFSPLGRFSDILVRATTADRFYGNVHGRFGGWFPTDTSGALPLEVSEFINEIGALHLGEGSARWTEVAESAQRIFGPCWAAYSIAINLAGARQAWQPHHPSSELFDQTVPICERARAARLRRGGPRWWLAQLSDAETQLDRMFWASLVLMWTSPDNLQSLAGEVNEAVQGFSEDEFYAVSRTLSAASSQRQHRSDRARLERYNLESFSERSGVLIALAMYGSGVSLNLSPQQMAIGELQSVAAYRSAISDIMDPPAWSDFKASLRWLRSLSEVRRGGFPLPAAAISHMREASFDRERAGKIYQQASELPIEIMRSCIRTFERSYRPASLTSIARDQAWSFD